MKTRTQVEQAIADLKLLENAWLSQGVTHKPVWREHCNSIAREFETQRRTLEWVLGAVFGPANNTLPPYAADTRL